MHRIPLFLGLALLAACQSTERATPHRSKRPNIVFIFSDDHAPHAISAYGSKINKTPHIDRLAKEGMLFTNTFCGNSICGPSRATILTGLHCHAHGFMRNGNRFDGDQRTFPKLLQKAGYQTAMIGKWHLTSNPTGFDYWRVLPGQGDYYNPDFITPEGRQKTTGYCTELTTQFALDWLTEGRDKGKPFLLMCQHKAPHRTWMPGPNELSLYDGETIPEPATLFDDYAGRGRAATRQQMEIDRHMNLVYDLHLKPYPSWDPKAGQSLDRSGFHNLRKMTPQQLATWDAAFAKGNAEFASKRPTGEALVRWKYQRYIKNYLRCVAGVDKSVGQLLDYIDSDPELARNTIIVYSSDQGFYLGDHGWYDKRWMYDESLRMPFVVRWPGQIRAGTRSDALTQNIDFGPTFLDLCGVDVPADMHGRSMQPLLRGARPADWRDAVYYHYYESHAVHMVGAHYGVRTDRYKLMYFYEPENRYWELYDLERDPDERTNEFANPKYAHVVMDLKARLSKLRKKYGDTTGTVGDFDLTAGVASVQRYPEGRHRIRANASGTYLLHRPKQPLKGTVMLSTEVDAVERGKGLGLIVFTGGHPRRRLFRVGVDFWKRQLVFIEGMRVRQSTAIDIGDVPIRVTVQADLARGGFSVTAGGKTLQGKLPKNWQGGLTSYGYGLSDSTIDFSKLTVVGR